MLLDLFDLGRARSHRHFEQTVRAYSAELYRYAYWLCRDRFVAEDLVQEVFARAWRAWGSLKNDGSLKAWLMTILRNEHARLYERRQVERVDVELDELEIADHDGPQSLHELGQLLEQLPESLREPLILQVLGGYSCAEIAALLETTEGAVMTRLTRARQALRGVLAGIAEHRSVKA